MKYQGMVGIMGNGGETRLTWFVNMDFGGIIPSSFTNAFVVGTVGYPITVVKHAKDHLLKEGSDGGKGANSATTTLSASELHEENAELKAQVLRNDEELRELRRKDKEHVIALANKDKEIMELRRRLPRTDEGED